MILNAILNILGFLLFVTLFGIFISAFFLYRRIKAHRFQKHNLYPLGVFFISFVVLALISYPLYPDIVDNNDTDVIETQHIIDDTVDEYSEENIESMIENMEGKRVELENEVKTILPEALQKMKWFSLEVQVVDNDIFKIYVKIDLQNDTVDGCKEWVINNIHSFDKLNYNIVSYEFDFVNNGTPVCMIIKNEDGKLYLNLNDGKAPTLWEF